MLNGQSEGRERGKKESGSAESRRKSLLVFGETDRLVSKEDVGQIEGGGKTCRKQAKMNKEENPRKGEKHAAQTSSKSKNLW